MRKKISYSPITFSLVLLALLTLAAMGQLVFDVQELRAEINVDASLSHLSFPQDKAARLTITVIGTSRNASFELPEIENIRFHNQGQSSQFMLTNGSVSAQISHNYLVQGLKTGKYTLPPIEVTAGGETSQTKAINFQITPAGQQANTPGTGRGQEAGEMAFLRISETGSHYPGEIVPLTLKAYFTQKYRADIQTLPTLQGDGVVMSQLSNEPKQTVESVNGINYHVLTWQTSLSGIKVGEHPIRFAMEATMLIPQQRRPRSPFGGSSLFDDPFFGGSSLDNFFGGHQRKPIISESPEVIFKVLPLPTKEQPADFTGAIGDFDLEVTASPVKVEVGEPITLTMKVTGQGNFDRVEAPVFPESAEWKTYSPTTTFPPKGDTTSSDSKIFEQALVIKNGGVRAIPSLSFSYFDPKKKSYINKKSSPIVIQLKGGAAAPQATEQPPQHTLQAQQTGQKSAVGGQQPASPAPIAPPGMFGLAPIHLETGNFYKRIVPLFLTPLCIALFLLSLLILLALLFIKIRLRDHQKHPEKWQQKKNRFMLQEDLKRIELAQTAGDSATFLSLSRNAIQQQLGQQWNIEPAALSLADLKDRLQAGSPLIAIFSLAEEAAYGGASLTEEKMQTYFSTLKSELEALL